MSGSLACQLSLPLLIRLLGSIELDSTALDLNSRRRRRSLTDGETTGGADTDWGEERSLRSQERRGEEESRLRPRRGGRRRDSGEGTTRQLHTQPSIVGSGSSARRDATRRICSSELAVQHHCSPAMHTRGATKGTTEQQRAPTDMVGDAANTKTEKPKRTRRAHGVMISRTKEDASVELSASNVHLDRVASVFSSKPSHASFQR